MKATKLLVLVPIIISSMIMLKVLGKATTRSLCSSSHGMLYIPKNSESVLSNVLVLIYETVPKKSGKARL